MTGSAQKSPSAVLFDRDATLIVDVPYNGDPDRVELMPTAAEALAFLRVRRIPVGVVSNQSAVGHGWITPADVLRVNKRVESLLGEFGTWQVCPHTADDGCQCRKPKPRLIYAAASALGFPTSHVVMIGDIAADLRAAAAAGARSVLVPTATTRRDEVDAAEHVAPDLLSAVQSLFPPPSHPPGASAPRTNPAQQARPAQRIFPNQQ